MKSTFRTPWIQSLDRGLQILEFVGGQERPVRLDELAHLLGVEKSSAYRLAATLANRGYLRMDRDSKGYVLHDKVFDLAGQLAGRRRIQIFAPKHLKRLAEETGETAHLAVRGRDRVIFVDHEYGHHAVGVIGQCGNAEPLHCTAVGKALLVGLNEKDLRKILESSLRRYTPRTITSFRRLAKQCADAGESMLAIDDGEFRPGVRCLASPVYDIRGRVTAAIGISGPTERLDDQAIRQFGRKVRQYALEFSHEMGYRRDEVIGNSLKTEREFA